MPFQRLIRRLGQWLRQRRFDAELREELAFHRDSKQREFERAGLSPREAAHAAARAMGSVTLAREDARAVWTWSWCQSISQDAAYALRTLRRQPSFALVPVGALAIAIGISVSLFTAFNAVILRPWPVKDPGRVVAIFTQDAAGVGGFSVPESRYLQDQVRSLTGLVIRWQAAARLGDEPVGKATRGYAVSGNFFDVLGVGMVHGRGFLPEDDRLEAPHAVAVLSYRLWQARFGGDPGVVGKTIQFNSVPVTVVGVASRTFTGIEPNSENFWIPLSVLPTLEPDDLFATRLLHQPRFCCAEVAGRLAPGVTAFQARAELALLSQQFRGQIGIRIQPIVVTGTTFLERPNSKRQVLPLFALMFLGVALVLLIACANISNLLIARAVARAREMGVRVSLGASRVRLIRQLLTESLVLAIGAGVIGTALAYQLPDAMLTLAGEPPPFSIVPDMTVLGFALILTLAVCIGAGLAPALHGTHRDVASALKDQRGSGGPHLAVRNVLLAIQVAVSVCLLTAATLCARSIQYAEGHELDFAVADVSIASFEFPMGRSDQAFVQGFFAQLATDVAAARVGPFALSSVAPLSGVSADAPVRLPGEGREHQRRVTMQDVSAGYFGVLGIAMVVGRDFDPADVSRHVLVVNEAMAHRYWPAGSPIGQTLFLWTDSYEIVGVIKDAHTARLDDVEPTIYRPFTAASTAVLLLRKDPSAATAVASIVPRIAAGVRIQIAPLEAQVSHALAPSRAGAILAGFLGLFALLLATIGMWGVFGYVVHQRTREIGIRLALGASPRQIVRLVLAGNSRALLVGFAVGLSAAASGSHVLRRYLFGLSPLDPTAFGLVMAILAAAALAASYGPSRRASRVDPTAALRTL